MSLLGSIDMETWAQDGHTWGRLPVQPWVCGPGGALRLGVLSILVDVVVGAQPPPRGAVNPTTDMVMQWTSPPRPGAVVRAESNILKWGGRLIVGETAIRDEASEETIGWGSATFINRPVGDGNDWGEPRHWGGPGEPHESVEEALGVEQVRRGVVDLPMTDAVNNPTAGGTVQGGIQTILAELAAEQAAGDGYQVVHLGIRFMNRAKIGPLRAIATALPGTGTGARADRTMRVELVDAGDDNRIVSHAVATACLL
jgi:acyl-coenzyme A thioesterase PaaI-like protein